VRIDRGNRSGHRVAGPNFFGHREEIPGRGVPTAHYFGKPWIIGRRLYYQVLMNDSEVKKPLKPKITEYLAISPPR
jgi:hypothetical protein